MTQETWQVLGLFTGAVAQRWDGRAPSAIHKTAADGTQSVTHLGLSNDAQADLEAHGGLDKALHQYPEDHYADWQEEGMIPPGMRPAAFGENISTRGLTEETVCIGDMFRLGTALVQVSQGRQPCWKLSAHTGQEKMAYRFHKTGRTGWYLRVLEEGTVSKGQQMTLIERDKAQVSVRVATRAVLDRKASAEELSRLVALEALSPEWRSFFETLKAD